MCLAAFEPEVAIVATFCPQINTELKSKILFAVHKTIHSFIILHKMKNPLTGSFEMNSSE